MIRYLSLAGFVFAGVLAVYVAPLLSSEARGVAFGIVVGLLASAPTTIILLYLLRRERAAHASPAPRITTYPPSSALARREWQ